MSIKKENPDIDFEIRFYESILKESPEFVEALIVLGNLYTRAGSYEKGLAIDQRLIKLRPKEAIVFYNFACSNSLLNNPEVALKSLAKAIRLGYRDWKFMAADPDLENLRKDGRFQVLLEKLKPPKAK